MAITVAEYTDVLLIPVAAVVEQGDRFFCWVQTSSGPRRTEIQIGDSDEVFDIVERGLNEGDEVLLNPAAHEKPVAEEATIDVPTEDAQKGDES